MTDWLEDQDEPYLAEHRWPRPPNHLLPRERWLWWEQLWTDVLMLADRYRIRPMKDWWENATQVEALRSRPGWSVTTPANGMTRRGFGGWFRGCSCARAVTI